MKKQPYRPAPVDVSDVVLPPELSPLVEQIARNVHDVWAEGRLAEGWTYGPLRDDALKQHPGLVDYDELPESEREYDRATALGTLKLITKFGFRIVKD